MPVLKPIYSQSRAERRIRKARPKKREKKRGRPPDRRSNTYLQRKHGYKDIIAALATGKRSIQERERERCKHKRPEKIRWPETADPTLVLVPDTGLASLRARVGGALFPLFMSFRAFYFVSLSAYGLRQVRETFSLASR